MIHPIRQYLADCPNPECREGVEYFETGVGGESRTCDTCNGSGKVVV